MIKTNGFTPLEEAALRTIRERCDKATQGPWQAEDIGAGTVACGVVSESEIVIQHDFISPRNAEFVAHARQDIPLLLAEIERLRQVADLVAHRQAEQDAQIAEKFQYMNSNTANHVAAAIRAAASPMKEPQA